MTVTVFDYRQQEYTGCLSPYTLRDTVSCQVRRGPTCHRFHFEELCEVGIVEIGDANTVVRTPASLVAVTTLTLRTPRHR